MPVAVVVEDSVRKELKSCPPDGYVIIRRMNYGESLVRKDMMASIAMQMDSKTRESATLQMDLLQEKTALWEFANLVVEHNLQNKDQSLLDFKKAEHVKLIRGPIGDEIQLYINQLNSFEDDEEVKN